MKKYTPKLMLGHDIAPLVAYALEQPFLPFEKETGLSADALLDLWITQQLHNFDIVSSIERPYWTDVQRKVANTNEPRAFTILYQLVSVPLEHAGDNFLVRRYRHLLWVVYAS